jgi:hypothetical protein
MELKEQTIFEQYLLKLNSRRDTSRQITEIKKMFNKNTHDIFFKRNDNKKYIVELKHRYVNTYELNATPLYINTFNDLSMVVFDLNQINFHFKNMFQKMLPKTTLEKTELVKKNIYYLLSSEGIVSTLNI